MSPSDTITVTLTRPRYTVIGTPTTNTHEHEHAEPVAAGARHEHQHVHQPLATPTTPPWTIATNTGWVTVASVFPLKLKKRAGVQRHSENDSGFFSTADFSSKVTTLFLGCRGCSPGAIAFGRGVVVGRRGQSAVGGMRAQCGKFAEQG